MCRPAGNRFRTLNDVVDADLEAGHYFDDAQAAAVS